MAGFLSRLCCYKRCLPQGACTSPALSNICFRRCDDEIAALAKRYGLTYTRYSDDIYLSGNVVPVPAIVEEVKRIVAQYGFRINYKKTKVLHQHQAQKVTAIIVNDKMQVNREYRRQLRQELYYLNRFGINSKAAQEADGYTEYLYKLHGRVSFVLYIDPENKEFIEAKKKLEKMIDASCSLYPPKWAFCAGCFPSATAAERTLLQQQIQDCHSNSVSPVRQAPISPLSPDRHECGSVLSD